MLTSRTNFKIAATYVVGKTLNPFPLRNLTAVMLQATV